MHGWARAALPVPNNSTTFTLPVRFPLPIPSVSVPCPLVPRACPIHYSPSLTATTQYIPGLPLRGWPAALTSAFMTPRACAYL